MGLEVRNRGWEQIETDWKQRQTAEVGSKN